jgi:predicted nucleotidyltransferase
VNGIDPYPVTDATATIAPSRIREEVLRDPRYPVHGIADRLLPYLRVLLEQFRPERVILFGSYAYGNPHDDSDVDLLIIKEILDSPLKEKIRIRKAWWNEPGRPALLPFDLIVVDWKGHEERLEHSAGFYDDVVLRGLRLA